MNKIEYLKIKLDLEDENNKKLNKILLKPEKIEKPINIKEDTKFKSIKDNIFKRLDAQLKNQKEYNKLYGIDETLLNVNIAPTEEQKKIKFTELIANREVLYSDEFNLLFNPYLNDDNLIRVNGDLTEQERREFVLNWALYKNRLEELQGQRLEYNRFIDYLHDMVRKSILEKGIYGRRRELEPVDNLNQMETINNNDIGIEQLYSNDKNDFSFDNTLNKNKLKNITQEQKPSTEEKEETDKIQLKDKLWNENKKLFDDEGVFNENLEFIGEIRNSLSEIMNKNYKSIPTTKIRSEVENTDIETSQRVNEYYKRLTNPSNFIKDRNSNLPIGRNLIINQLSNYADEYNNLSSWTTWIYNVNEKYKDSNYIKIAGFKNGTTIITSTILYPKLTIMNNSQLKENKSKIFENLNIIC
jgi:hypothetical protein